MKLFKGFAAGITALALMVVPTMGAYAVTGNDSPAPTQQAEVTKDKGTESAKGSGNGASSTTVEAKVFGDFFAKVTMLPGNSYKDAKNSRFFVKTGETARFSVQSQDASLTTHIDKVVSGDNGVQSYQAVLPTDENGTPVYSLAAGEYKAYQTGGEPASSVDVASIAKIPSFEVKADGAIPEVVDTQSQSIVNGTQSAEKGYSLKASRFTFNDADSGANANSVTVKVTKTGSNEQPWAFNRPFDAGMYLVSVQVADNVGNLSQPYTFNLKVSDTNAAYSAVTLKSGEGVYFNDVKPSMNTTVYA